LLKVISSKLVRVSVVINRGDGPFRSVLCAYCLMAVSWEDGSAIVGNSLDKGNENRAVEAMVERYERLTSETEAILECIVNLVML
jgi:hypothetical protein